MWTPWVAGRLTALLLIQERSTARLNPQTNVFSILKVSSGIFCLFVNLEFTKMWYGHDVKTVFLRNLIPSNTGVRLWCVCLCVCVE